MLIVSVEWHLWHAFALSQMLDAIFARLHSQNDFA